MTPEQEKAKGIVEKYRKITYIDEYGNENYERLSLGAAKACAIEEVKAVIEENKSILQLLERHGSERSMLPVRFRIQDLEQLLTEIEKL